MWRDAGSDGGAARVRATGTDDFFWLIELELIERSLVKSLTAVYHGRVKYPDQRTA